MSYVQQLAPVLPTLLVKGLDCWYEHSWSGKQKEPLYKVPLSQIWALSSFALVLFLLPSTPSHPWKSLCQIRCDCQVKYETARCISCLRLAIGLPILCTWSSLLAVEDFLGDADQGLLFWRLDPRCQVSHSFAAMLLCQQSCVL